jgi:hypothetical protein
MPMMQDSFFAGLSSISPCMTFDKSTRLLSIMAMASHGRQVFSLLCVVWEGKGFEDEFLDDSDLS